MFFDGFFSLTFSLVLRLRPPDKSAIVELFFLFLIQNVCCGTQKNRLNDQNPGKKIPFYSNKMSLPGSMELLNMVFTLTQKE